MITALLLILQAPQPALQLRASAKGALMVSAHCTVDLSYQRAPVRVTPDIGSNDQLLYFTSSSLTADDRHLYFISDRTGSMNVFCQTLATGKQHQVSANTEGFLKSYVYFDGQPYRGFGRASASLDTARARLYYLQGRQVCRVDADGTRYELAELPDNQVTAFTHVSTDGRRLCVPTTDARALDDSVLCQGNAAIDRCVQEERLNSYLHIYDTDTGTLLASERVPCGWVTHVQFSPADANHVLYNHEWPSDCGVRRMWLWDGVSHRPLRDEKAGRSRNDWTCHEMWERDGHAVIYHGMLVNGLPYLGRLNPATGVRTELEMPAVYQPYGHFTVGQPCWLVTDGHYVGPDDSGGNHGRWISLVQVDWAAGTMRWIPLCESGSSWHSQDEHPHPIFDHAGLAVYFTSDRNGRRAVYRIDVSDIVLSSRSCA